TDAYRGAGRPETTFYLERAVDAAARSLGMDPIELRKKNYFRSEDFPADTLVGMTMDSGDYGANLDALGEKAGIAGLRAMQESARAEGRHVGVGIATYVEACGLAPSGFADAGVSWAGYGLPSAFNESAVVRVHPDASATVITGTAPTGQGHETVWSQIVSDRLAIPMEKINVIHGDTKDTPMGIGTGGSRSMAVGGVAVSIAADRTRNKASKIAAHLLEAAEDDIVFADGGAHVAGSPDKNVPWTDIAAAAYQPHKLPEGMEAGLDMTAFFDPANLTWPYGSHAAVVEVDVDTGDVKLLRYVAMDDCGNIVNPMIVAGQIQGGVAQGIGQALFEGAVFDDDGTLITSTLADYPIPTATDVPSFELGHTVTPTDANPLGVKGIGEAGTIVSTPTIVNAVIDALAPLGVKHIDMPLRPSRVWQAIQEARA
ncbi:MAG: molybdopterin cofactor-binding domain-containing protein, partial [Acidimicrobiia bacterium]